MFLPRKRGKDNFFREFDKIIIKELFLMVVYLFIEYATQMGGKLMIYYVTWQKMVDLRLQSVIYHTTAYFTTQKLDISPPGNNNPTTNNNNSKTNL